jgi:hypothetical protein
MGLSRFVRSGDEITDDAGYRSPGGKQASRTFARPAFPAIRDFAIEMPPLRGTKEVSSSTDAAQSDRAERDPDA